MSAGAPDPVAAALFLVVAMSLAGCVHIAWLKSVRSRRFAQPIDYGVTVRGRRLFGENKRVRGFVAMPLAGAAAFALLGGARGWLPHRLGMDIWPLSTVGYAVFGLACGVAFMMAELPNSFLKRQLDIPPGQPAASRWLRAIFFVVDRCDSVLGVLVVASLLVPVAPATWLWALILGPSLHAAFSVLLHRLGEKGRAL
jgi:CDP-2,3-bis-(O-geranylgeranyl)-sn-glycerol synthase